MIRLIAIGIVTVATIADAHVSTFTTRPDKREFGFFEPVEVTSKIVVSANSPGQAYPEGISENVVYEVEREFHGTFLPVPSNLRGAGGPVWQAKVEDVTVDNTALTGTMDLRILYDLGSGRYRVRGKYRSDFRSSAFDKVSEWSEFEIKPMTTQETITLKAFEAAGGGNSAAERLASYEAFAAKYPTEDITARVYPEIQNFYFKTGDKAGELDFLKKVIGNRNISEIQRRLYAYEIAGMEEKNGRMDEAIQWYRQCGLRNSEHQIEKLQGKAN
jgi:hypothetical protein